MVYNPIDMEVVKVGRFDTYGSGEYCPFQNSHIILILKAHLCGVSIIPLT